MIAALILAAGVVPEDSKRKLTDYIGGASSIRRLILVFRQAGIRKIVVVTGYDAEAVENHCSRMGVVFLRNEAYETEDKLSSVKIGLNYLKNKCARAFMAPTHVPFFSAETVKALESAEGQVVIPCYNKKAGHPILISESIFDHILTYNGDGGLKSALSQEGTAYRFIDVDDKGVLADTRKRANVSGLIKNQSLKKIRPEAKIQLISERGFFGPGTLLLLNLTREFGSLKQAAIQMGMSYSKAIKMITVTEEQLGYKVLESRQGGVGGGSSIITKNGLDLMRRYEAFESECTKFVNEAFKKHFT